MDRLFFWVSFFLQIGLAYGNVRCDVANLEILRLLNGEPGQISQLGIDSYLVIPKSTASGPIGTLNLDMAYESAAKLGINSNEELQNLILLSRGVFGSEVDSITNLEILVSRLRGAKGKVGVELEDHLEEAFRGKGSFKVSGREFDGVVGNIWYEAKSGNYWSSDYGRQGFQKFKSDMGARFNIAKENGKEYHLISNTPITNEAKEWLIQKGIKFLEILD